MFQNCQNFIFILYNNVNENYTKGYFNFLKRFKVVKTVLFDSTFDTSFLHLFMTNLTVFQSKLLVMETFRVKQNKMKQAKPLSAVSIGFVPELHNHSLHCVKFNDEEISKIDNNKISMSKCFHYNEKKY